MGKVRQATVGHQYQVPDSDLVLVRNRPTLSAKALRYSTGDDAGHHVAADGLAFVWLDQRGRVGVITWNGIEIALYFKRKLVSVPISPLENVTLIPMAPTETWVKVDLLESNPRKVKMSSELLELRKQLDELERARRQLLAENGLLLQRADQAEESRDAALSENKLLMSRLKVLQKNERGKSP